MPLSRICRDRIGRRFQPLENEQQHAPNCLKDVFPGEAFCPPNCRARGAYAPAILHAIWINDLCDRDPVTPVHVYYSDEVARSTHAMTALQQTAWGHGRHPGQWPYTQIEIDCEIVRDGRWIDGRLHPRFRLSELRAAFPPEFLRVASELRLEVDRLFEIARLHADPRVELAILAAA